MKVSPTYHKGEVPGVVELPRCDNYTRLGGVSMEGGQEGLWTLGRLGGFGRLGRVWGGEGKTLAKVWRWEQPRQGGGDKSITC